MSLSKVKEKNLSLPLIPHAETGFCFLSQGEFIVSLAGMTEMLSLPIVQCRISISELRLIKQENTKKENGLSQLTPIFHPFHEILLT